VTVIANLEGHTDPGPEKGEDLVPERGGPTDLDLVIEEGGLGPEIGGGLGPEIGGGLETEEGLVAGPETAGDTAAQVVEALALRCTQIVKGN